MDEKRYNQLRHDSRLLSRKVQPDDLAKWQEIASATGTLIILRWHGDVILEPIEPNARGGFFVAFGGNMQSIGPEPSLPRGAWEGYYDKSGRFTGGPVFAFPETHARCGEWLSLEEAETMARESGHNVKRSSPTYYM